VDRLPLVDCRQDRVSAAGTSERLAVVPVRRPSLSETFDLAARWPLAFGTGPCSCSRRHSRGQEPGVSPRAARSAGEVASGNPAALRWSGAQPRCGRWAAARPGGDPWARHIGAVPHAQMSSLCPGGCGRELLDFGGRHGQLGARGALARPRVLASDIAGNRSLIEHGQTGLLFRDEAEFERAQPRSSRSGASRSPGPSWSRARRAAVSAPPRGRRLPGGLSRADRSAGVQPRLASDGQPSKGPTLSIHPFGS